MSCQVGAGLTAGPQQTCARAVLTGGPRPEGPLPLAGPELWVGGLQGLLSSVGAGTPHWGQGGAPGRPGHFRCEPRTWQPPVPPPQDLRPLCAEVQA